MPLGYRVSSSSNGSSVISLTYFASASNKPASMGNQTCVSLKLFWSTQKG